MEEELSTEAVNVAHELSQHPALNALREGEYAASWENAEEEDSPRDAIEVYKIVGVDSCPEADQKTIHGRRLATLSLREARNRDTPGDETVAAQSADVA